MEEKNKFFQTYKEKVQVDSQLRQGEGGRAEAPTATGMKYQMESGFVKPATPASAPVEIPGQPRRWTGIIVGAVILLALVIGIILFLNRGVELIDFTGWLESDAQLWARNHDILLQVEKEYNDDFEAGKVFAQDKAAGTRVKKGSFVRLTVSLGHDLSVTLPLPDLMSMTRGEIEQWAAQNYMSRVRITVEYSDQVPEGRVIRYEINDDRVVDEVRRDSPIYVIISRGPESQQTLVKLPDFKQMPLAQCFTFANENGLVLTVQEEYDDYIPPGTIISQSHKAEESVPRGTEILLVVSKGKKILVPNFAGHSRDKAMAIAGGLGITVVMGERYSSSPAGAFLSQSLKAGSIYEPGEILELTYSIGNQVGLPSFVGSTQAELESWANDLNSKGAKITVKVTTTRSNAPKGTIIYQDKANQAIGIKTTINVTVSLGRVVYVPDLVAPAGAGYDTAITREKAIAICEAHNIIPIFVAEANPDRLPGEVWAQSLAAGSETSEGTTITLKYVPATVQVQVPNFIGMTREEIQTGDYNRILDIQFVEGEVVEGKANQVIAQSLLAGTQVASGSSIILTVSPGSP